MKVLAALGHGAGWSTVSDVVRLPVGAEEVEFAVLEVPTRPVDLGEHPHHVRVGVRAFSLNYRDRALMTGARQARSPRILGSEFAGVVEEVGHRVTRFAVGDRVMAEMSWPTNGARDVLGGVPTNGASAEALLLHEAKLSPVPEELSDAEAAGFALCAQTAWPMVRRSRLGPGDRALVLAATSNTSLAAIQRLHACGVEVTAATRRAEHADALRTLGAGAVLDTRGGLDSVHEAARASGLFDAILDPFADVHLIRALGALRFFGRYVTCGVMAQGESLPERRDCDLADVVAALVVKNVELIGNCLGRPRDLREAAHSVSESGLRPIIDSVHPLHEVAAFLERSLVAGDRFGKVIALHDP